MSARACDRCHQVKERCSKTKGSDKCSRCLRLDLGCRTVRPLLKTGRPPAFARRITYQNLATCSTSPARTTLSAQESIRHEPQSHHDSGVQHASLSDEANSLNSITDATDQERYLLSLALGDKRSAGRYVIGPSFHERHQRALIKGLQTAPALLKDAYVSCATLIAAEQGIEVPASVQEHCQQRAAVGVSLLRGVKVTNRQEAASCVLLGFLLVTFAKYVALGEVLAICRYTLDQIKPVYEASGDFEDEDYHCFLQHLVLTETIECLFEAQMPVLRLEHDQHGTVDRFLGVSSSLLPPLHSLARLNCMGRYGDDMTGGGLVQEVAEVETLLLGWTPPAQMDHISDHFESTEVNYMLRQAKVMKETMLLIAHRLQHPYGSHTARANELLQSICNELELLMAHTGRTLNIAGLSLMATSFEADDTTSQGEALDKLDRLTSLSSPFRTRLRRSLLNFWSAKQQQQVNQQYSGLYWYDVSRSYLSPVSPS